MQGIWKLKAIAWLVAFGVVLFCMFGSAKLSATYAAIIGCIFLTAEQVAIGAYVRWRERHSWGAEWNDAIKAAQEARNIEDKISTSIARDWEKQRNKKSHD